LENLRQKLKIFNYRPLVLVFLSVIVGVLTNNFVFENTIVTIVGLIIVAILLALYSVLHKKFKYIIIFGLCFILGFGCFEVYMSNHIYKPNNVTGKYASGVVTNIVNYTQHLELLIEDVVIDGQELDYSISVKYYNIYQSGYIKVENGSKIRFKIEDQSLPKYYDEGVPNSYDLGDNVGLYASTNEIQLLGVKNSVRYTLLNKIRNNLRNGLNNLNGEMIYSAMFGDRTNLNKDLYDAYKGAGVAHLLAVSGLHVGLVVAILYWILKKCRVQGWWRVAIITPILLFYAYLCGFSYSIMRATIMSVILMIAPLLFSEYDLLSSICFAGSVILLIEPTAIFDISAQLSFGCLFGIALLYPLFKGWLSKIKISHPLTDSFCLSLSTILSTSVFMALTFGYLQPVGLMSNILLIPLFSILFSITFVVAILSLVLPFISFALILINPLFEWLNWAIIFISHHAHVWMTPSINYLTIILFFIVIACLSKFNLKKGTTKLTMLSLATMILALQIYLI